jgi:hypothetical protein
VSDHFVQAWKRDNSSGQATATPKLPQLVQQKYFGVGAISVFDTLEDFLHPSNKTMFLASIELRQP